MDEIRKTAAAIYASGTFSNCRSVEQAIVFVLTGNELGLQPMIAMRSLQVVKGKICLSADMMEAVALKRCSSFDLVESTADRCTYTTKRYTSSEPQSYTYTMEEAVRSGIAKGEFWRKYPEAMLRARCKATLARIAYPDLLAGIYDPEEMK